MENLEGSVFGWLFGRLFVYPHVGNSSDVTLAFEDVQVIRPLSIEKTANTNDTDDTNNTDDTDDTKDTDDTDDTNYTDETDDTVVTDDRDGRDDRDEREST